jgi:hypothetical protein
MLKVNPHMLRHACGQDTRALQAYLGHRNIQHTVRYTELRPDRFKDFWRYADEFSISDVLFFILTADSIDEQCAILAMAAWFWDGDSGYGSMPGEDEKLLWEDD